MTVYWVRHGQTDGNRTRVVQTPDTPLSSLGHQQVKLLANAYEKMDIELILCSDHTRTQQSAAPLHQSLNCAIEYSALLRERNFGELRGKSYDSIKEDFFAHDYQPPKGESHSQFVQRVMQAWDWVQEKAARIEGSVLVMTHGLVLRAMLTEKVALNESQFLQLDFDNTCVTSISKTRPWQIGLLCDVSHLEDNLSSDASVQGAV